jgi:hypothetical protein
VDKSQLQDRLRRALRGQPQITLHAMLETEPLQNGLAELIAWLELAHADNLVGGASASRAIIDETIEEPIHWQTQDANGAQINRLARLPRVIFLR